MPTLGLLFIVFADLIADQCEDCAKYVGIGVIAMIVFALIGQFWLSKQPTSEKSNKSVVLEGGKEALLITVTRD